MTRALMITASHTGVGKTLLTAGLCWQMRGRGQAVRAIKPVITGFDPLSWHESDTALLLQAMEEALTLENAARVSPYRFAAPVSPHLAAEREGRELRLEDVAASCKQAMAHDGLTLIEGAGGLCSPIACDGTQLDLIKRLDVPLVIVSGSYVGAIGHTLSVIEAARAHGLNIRSVIVSESAEKQTTAAETSEAILRFSPVELRVVTLARIFRSPAWQSMPEVDIC